MRLCRVTERGAKAVCTDAKKTPDLAGKVEFVDNREPAAVIGVAATDEGNERLAFSLVDGSEVKLRSGLRKGYALEGRGKDLFLLEVSGGLVAEQKKLPLHSDAEAAEFAGWLGWFETEGEARKLSLQKIGAGATLEGERTILEGELPPRIEPCGGTLYGRSASPSKLSVWFLQNGAWSKPVSGPLPAGQREEWASQCSADRVTRFWVDKGGDKPKLGMLDCRPKGCDKHEVEWKGAAAKTWFAVADLGGKTAALIETYDDDKRLYLAPLDELGSSPPMVITDSPEFSGEKFESPRVVIAKDYVVVVFSSEKSLHGLFVNASAHGPIAPAS